jgi:CRISPR/Cas system-associated exonuclease Cas4 (RecB family)
MSKYYNPQRSRNLYDPRSKEPFRISRSKIELFINCPRCFYFDRRLGVGQPPGYPFALNSAVDSLLKAEFDAYREQGKPHPYMVEAGIDAIPLKHEKLAEWRDALKRGVAFLHPQTNFLITGGIDDVWVNPRGELIVVDYKSTSKAEEVTIDADWQIAYKRQMEIYQWLFLRNGFKVNPTGYFVYCNGIADAAAFNQRLDFEVKLIPYAGDPSWIEEIILSMHRCLSSSILPETGKDCDFCKYREAIRVVET